MSKELKDKIHSLNSRLKRQIANNKLQDKQLKRLEKKYMELIYLTRKKAI
jgi:hypothetical protein